jgi:hypothetical protein
VASLWTLATILIYLWYCSTLLICSCIGIISYSISYAKWYMQRWKEQYFVNVGVDCGLTIAGFYYVCFSCSDGSISGFYYDPNSR